VSRINPARGEFAFTAAGQSFRLVATAANLAALEVQSGAYGFREIVRRLNALSLHTIRAALVCMDATAVNEVEVSAKVSQLGTNDLIKAAWPIVQAISFELGGPPGNGSGAEGK
jgi:hypothetical protein